MVLAQHYSRRRPPILTIRAGKQALRAMLAGEGILGGLAALHAELGDVFQLVLPGFNPVVLVGPEANRFVLVTERDHLLWCPDFDPVARLLRQGVLVTDGEQHANLRRVLAPALHKGRLSEYSQAMLICTESVTSTWQTGEARDMLVEMRRIALLILMETLFAVDFLPDIDRLFPAILKTLAFISPDLWVLWPAIPRPGFASSLETLDRYFNQIIVDRTSRKAGGTDLLSHLIQVGWTPDLIRDQMLTLFIAGHDTSTALLTWTLYLLVQRNCLGLAFAQVEARIVLAHLLQHFDFELLPRPAHPHMSATLEPRPAVYMRLRRRWG
jgi:cytochrome P450